MHRENTKYSVIEVIVHIFYTMTTTVVEQQSCEKCVDFYLPVAITYGYVKVDRVHTQLCWGWIHLKYKKIYFNKLLYHLGPQSVDRHIQQTETWRGQVVSFRVPTATFCLHNQTTVQSNLTAIYVGVKRVRKIAN